MTQKNRPLVPNTEEPSPCAAIMTMDEYISIIVEALEILPKSMIVHRITGDGKKDLLVEPKWSLNKLKVLTSIDKELKIRDAFQGKRFDTLS